jgi:hypothetical protein
LKTVAPEPALPADINGVALQDIINDPLPIHSQHQSKAITAFAHTASEPTMTAISERDRSSSSRLAQQASALKSGRLT